MADQAQLQPVCGRRGRRNLLEVIVLAVTLALIVVFSALIPGFATFGNLKVILSNSASLVMLSCGMAVVIISRGLDLSIVAEMVAGATTFSILIGAGVAAPVALLLTVAVMILLGLLNGWLIAYVEIPAMLATLASAMLITGLFRFGILRGEYLLLLPKTDPAVVFLSGNVFPGLTVPVALMGATMLATWVLLNLSAAGHTVYAMGDNFQAARLTGLPVQLSKNWHNRPEGGVYAGTWFHGFTQLRLPARSTVELELNLVYGHYEGVAAASHAQLCLIGWGSNQQWDQSALGAWGESICYEPDQAQAQAAVLDVRPVMVRSMSNNQSWGWTHNVGGGDFFRYFAPGGQRVFPARMKTAYLRQCPVLTEVLYAGQSSDGRIAHQATVSLGRTDDLVRGIYRLRLDVRERTPFSRFVIAQIGADSYSYTGELKLALGNETGLLRDWDAHWGGGVYRTEPWRRPAECRGFAAPGDSRAKDGVGRGPTAGW